MQQFYIHKDEQQQGPFTKDELKDLKITRDTMVWFEGEENWKKAIEIDELKDIIKNIPPPIPTSPPIAPPLQTEKQKNEDSDPASNTTPGRNNTTLIVIVALFVILGGLGIYIYSNQQTKQMEIQRQLEEQNAKILEQEKIEAARLAEEEKQRKAAKAAQRQAELEALKYEYDQAVINLRAAKIKLEEVQKFQLLRTSSEKQEQVQAQLEIIRSWEKEVDRLQKEIDKY